MASLLESEIRRRVASAFRGKLMRGTLRREVPVGLDANGDLLPPAVQTFTFEGIRSSFDARFAAQAGIPETDVKILIIAGSCRTDPKKDDLTLIRGQWVKIRRILKVDPADAAYTLQGFDVPAPAAYSVAPAGLSVTALTPTQGTVGVTVNQFSGDLYLVVTTSATPPSWSQLLAGQNNAGTAAVFAAQQAVNILSPTQSIVATGLTADTNYWAHLGHQDVVGNRSAILTQAFATPAVEP